MTKNQPSNDAKNQKGSEVRVRIAPSPTGYLHVGTARAALYNWLHAKRVDGDFVVRIEDTDKERSKGEFEDDIMRHMEWLGLKWDKDNMYRQSEHIESHKEMLQKLLDEGKAYISYDEPPAEHGRTPADTREFRTNAVDAFVDGKQGVVRFKTPENETVTFTDTVRGEVSFDTNDIEDFSIARSLDNPLYNFVVTVDDAQMGITDVIRGEDHISNTPKQILLYQALGFDVPRFAHLPLLLAPDKSKLSKRKGSTSVHEFKEQGFLPEAMANYLVFLGWNAADEAREFYTLDELAEVFDLNRVRKSGSIFDIVKLRYFNNHYIREKSVDEFAEVMKSFLKNEYADDEMLKRALSIEQERAELLSEVEDGIRFYFEDITVDAAMLAWKEGSVEDTRASLEHGKQFIEGMDSVDELDELKSALLDEAGSYKEGDRGALLWPMRVALSGKEKSPSPFEIVWVLGKDESLKRIENALSKVQ